LSEAQLITIWQRIFDPIGIGKIARHDWEGLLDSLSRGSLTKDSTILSRMFEINMRTALERTKCIDQEEGELDMKRMQKMFKKRKIDVNVFN
jgi:hypothetical protein